MPALIVLTTTHAQGLMSESVFEQISAAAAIGINDVLKLKEGPKAVQVYELPARRTINANDVQLLVIASQNEGWLGKIDDVRDTIVTRIQELAGDEEVAAFFGQVGPVDSWTIMPQGSWTEFLPLGSG